jgi:hypothetical protein
MSDLLGFELPSTVGEPAPQTALPFEPADDRDADSHEAAPATADQGQVH